VRAEERRAGDCPPYLFRKDSTNRMTFGVPEWLWGLLFIPLLIALFVRSEHRGLKRLQQFVSARLLPQIWFAIAWACAGDRQSGATALGLHF